MKKIYTVEIKCSITTELSLRELQSRLDVGLLKYGVDEIPPEGCKQSISLDGYFINEYDKFNVSIDEEAISELV